MLKSKIFPGYAPEFHMLGRGYCAPKPNPLGTPALRASRASLGASFNHPPIIIIIIIY